MIMMLKKSMIAVLALMLFLPLIVDAQDNTVDVYLFYGQGCPHCVKAEDFFNDLNDPNVNLVEKEVYLDDDNRLLFETFSKAYNSEIEGVPTIFIDDKIYVGFSASMGEEIKAEIERCSVEECRDLVKIEQGEIEEDHSISLAKVLSLAVVDAINPCALAVLTMMLIAIITYNPKKKRNIIWAGLAFTASVFIMYMLYGLVIIRFFKLVQALTNVRLILYKLLGGVAVLLGLLQIKDFFQYKPGSVGTEMPLFLRPKVKKVISGITSPTGAFTVGAFVTLFLLPCTIGPYIILSGILSFYETLKMIPLLLLYNIIFVLPMIVITIIVYFGIRKVDDVSSWKEDNIRTLHLVSGVIILALGAAMLLGWV